MSISNTTLFDIDLERRLALDVYVAQCYGSSGHGSDIACVCGVIVLICSTHSLEGSLTLIMINLESKSSDQ